MATSKTPETKTTATDPSEEGAFKDISTELEQAKQDANQPAEFNEDGTVKVTDPSQATIDVNEELARRSAATANGGGPFPPEVLQKNFIGNSTQLKTPVQEYTSHEEAQA